MSNAGRITQLTLLTHEPHPRAFQVRESGRAKRMSIHVSPHTGVEVVVPKRTSPAQVERFVSEQRAWIDRMSHSLAQGAGLAMDSRLPDAVSLPAIDREWPVRYVEAARSGVCLRSSPVLEISGCVADEAACRDVLRRWLARLARDHLGKALMRLSVQTGLRYEKLQVRRQRTRWGSCSSRGTISLNYCLMFLTPELVRYLLAHELSHTRYMSHGPRFWGLLERIEPDCRALDARMDDAWRDIPGWVMR